MTSYVDERENCTLKSYVHNRRHAEGCISETHNVKEIITLRSRYMHGGVHTKFNRRARNNDECGLGDATTMNVF